LQHGSGHEKKNLELLNIMSLVQHKQW